MKKSFLALLPILITASILVFGICWLGYSFNKDQEQTFHVIESGQVEIEASEPETCSPNENVCMASTNLLSTTQ